MTVGRCRRQAQRRVQCTACGLQSIAARAEIDGVVAVATIGRTTTRGDQPTVAEQTQVVRHEALRLVDQHHQLPHGPIALHEFSQQPPPERVRREPDERWGIAVFKSGLDAALHPSDHTELDAINQMKLIYLQVATGWPSTRIGNWRSASLAGSPRSAGPLSLHATRMHRRARTGGCRPCVPMPSCSVR